MCSYIFFVQNKLPLYSNMLSLRLKALLLQPASRLISLAMIWNGNRSHEKDIQLLLDINSDLVLHSVWLTQHARSISYLISSLFQTRLRWHKCFF